MARDKGKRMRGDNPWGITDLQGRYLDLYIEYCNMKVVAAQVGRTHKCIETTLSRAVSRMGEKHLLRCCLAWHQHRQQKAAAT